MGGLAKTRKRPERKYTARSFRLYLGFAFIIGGVATLLINFFLQRW
ncbi:hypothetical protein TherJR_1948 [Thermincola potens JR]|uniref:Uncharacterized protein n=1 Tax=Thermincola potens (strain JR) TaxID=635013 RepID=D5X877_THEPJ|nr:hypothetical protein TherJR_1948 [Thermincola potens JR]